MSLDSSPVAYSSATMSKTKLDSQQSTVVFEFPKFEQV